MDNEYLLNFLKEKNVPCAYYTEKKTHLFSILWA